MYISKVAKRYAQGILDFTQSTGNINQVFSEMKGIIKIIGASEDLRVFLRTPIIDYHKKIKIMDEIFKDYSKDTLIILNLIIRQGREKYLKEIAAEYLEKAEDLLGVQRVTLTTAMPLNEKTKDDILKSTILVDTNKEVKVTSILNPDILGGFILRVGDQQIDQSVKTQLGKIKKEFQSAHLN